MSYLGDRAVVLGGGLAGLLAARQLSRAFGEVLVVERDEIVGVAGHRRGVPHGRHAHGLVARGHQILESQFPGLTRELVDAGVRPGDFNGDIRWYVEGRRLQPSTSGLVSVPATRPVLERHMRRRVEAIPAVRFLERHEVLGPVTTRTGDRVTGVRVQPRDAGAQPRVEAADLVVDTTGRGSRAPRWLEDLGYERPPEERVKIDLAYTTRHYRVPFDPLGSDLAIIPAATPQSPRGGLFYRVPGTDDQYELSLTGICGDHPPTDDHAFLEFVRSLPVPDIHAIIRESTPLDEAVSFRFPASVRRRYELLDRFPDRLLVMGDAVASFNPVYAQGMTVAALQSLVLSEHVSAGSVPRPQAFFRDIATSVDSPWQFSAGADLGYPGVEGRRTRAIRLVNGYVARLQRAAVHDASLTNAFIRVAGLVDPPSALLRPDRVVRVLRAPRGRRTPPPASSSPKGTREESRSWILSE